MQVNRRNIILISVLLIVSILLVVSSTLFSVKDIIINGNLTTVQTTSLKTYVKTIIKTGDSVFAIDKNYATRCIETNENFAELKVEKIEIEFPNKVSVTVSNRTARYYFGNGPYSILDSELKVIKRQTEVPVTNLKEIEFIILPVLPVAHKINDDVLREYTQLLEGTGVSSEAVATVIEFRDKIKSIRKDSDFNYIITTDKVTYTITHVNNKGVSDCLGQIIGLYNSNDILNGDILEVEVNANGNTTIKRDGRVIDRV